MTNTKENIVIKTVISNNNKVINDHNGQAIEIAGICQLQNGKIGAIFDTDKAYSINKLYVEDNQARLSRWSISGCVMPYENVITKEGIESFNKTITLDSQKITKVVLIKVINA